MIYEHLEKAVETLNAGLLRHSLQPEDDLIRDGVIQRFEYSMDLAWKLIQRHLKTDLQVDESRIRSTKDLFREAARLGLIENAEDWIAHYNARNETSHRYDVFASHVVFNQAKFFYFDAMKLLGVFKNASTS